MLEFQAHGRANRTRNEPVHSVQALALNPLAVNTEENVAHTNLPTLVGRRAGNDLADIDPTARLLVPVDTQ